MELKKSKKGVLDQFTPLIVGLAAIGIALAIGFLIFAEIQTQILSKAGADASSVRNDSTYSGAYNGTEDTINALADIPGWLPIIVVTVIGALLISLIAIFKRR